jgi:DNA-directed RNA polymerase subunit alpha
MAVEHAIDLKTLLVEKEDCDSGTVTQLRNALAEGGNQYRVLRDVTETLKKKAESAPPAVARKLALKIGIASYFLGFMPQAEQYLGKAESNLGAFYHGRSLMSLQRYDEALKAFEKAEKQGYSASSVQLQRAAIYRLQGELQKARTLLNKLSDQANVNAEYLFQVGSCDLAEGERLEAVKSFEKAVKLDPNHTGALFQLGHANDLAGNDEDAIGYYERCLRHPPVHVGTLKNLGILYEDYNQYEKAADCFKRILDAQPTDEEARLFLKDAEAAKKMYYSPEEEHALNKFSQVLEIPVTDFELSVRSRNCLKKMNIRTLGDLTRVTEAQLLSSKNFGETSLAEIKEMMSSKGLRLGQSLEEGARPELRYRPPQGLSEAEQAILNKPVTELNLSVRARKCMNRLGITTLGELVQRTADELLEAKNFGQTSLAEVRDKLAQYGLTLRGD